MWLSDMARDDTPSEQVPSFSGCLGVKFRLYMKKAAWSRKDKLAAAGLCVAVLAIVVGLLFPEVRRILGLEKPAPTPVAAEVHVPTSRPTTKIPDTHAPGAPIAPRSKPGRKKAGTASHPPSQTPAMSQECAPGASCAQSNGQQGGITAGTYIGHVDPPPRSLSNQDVALLRSTVAGHPCKILILYVQNDDEAYRLAK